MDGLQKMEKPYFLMDDLGGKRNPTIFGNIHISAEGKSLQSGCFMSQSRSARPTNSFLGLANEGEVKPLVHQWGCHAQCLISVGFMAKRKRFKAQEIP